MRRYLFVLLVFFATHADAQKLWALPDWAWAKAKEQGQGLSLKLSYGVPHHVPAKTVDLLIGIKERLTKESGQSHTLALSEFEGKNAFAIQHQGSPTIVLTLSLIGAIEGDPDALAIVYGHELAHLYLKHGGHDEREKRASQEGIAFMLAEERAADEQGIKWATAAGFDPCGQIRLYRRIGSPKERKWHPSEEERAVQAESYAKTKGRSCGLPG